MKIPVKILSGAALVVGLVSAGGAAFAGTSYQSYDAILPKLQQPWNSSSQAKTYSNLAGDISVSYVGSTYTINARLCNQSNGTCGTEVFGLDDNQSAELGAGFGAGTLLHLQLHSHEYAFVQIESVGSWRSY